MVQGHVYILPDTDELGCKHAAEVATHLHAIASEVRIVELPGLPPKGDVSDWLDASNDKEALLELCLAAVPFTPAKEKPPKPQKENVAVYLIEYLDECDLWHDERKIAYATVTVGDHRENLRIEGKEFRLWLGRQLWEDKRKTAYADMGSKVAEHGRVCAELSALTQRIGGRAGPTGRQLHLRQRLIEIRDNENRHGKTRDWAQELLSKLQQSKITEADAERKLRLMLAGPDGPRALDRAQRSITGPSRYRTPI